MIRSLRFFSTLIFSMCLCFAYANAEQLCLSERYTDEAIELYLLEEEQSSLAAESIVALKNILPVLYASAFDSADVATAPTTDEQADFSGAISQTPSSWRCPPGGYEPIYDNGKQIGCIRNIPMRRHPTKSICFQIDGTVRCFTVVIICDADTGICTMTGNGGIFIGGFTCIVKPVHENGVLTIKIECDFSDITAQD